MAITPFVLSALWNAFKQANAPVVFFKIPSRDKIAITAQIPGTVRAGTKDNTNTPYFIAAPFASRSVHEATAITGDYYHEIDEQTDIDTLNLPPSIAIIFLSILTAGQKDTTGNQPQPSHPAHAVSDKRDYISLVNKARDEIARGSAEKIVVSRRHTVPIDKKNNIIEIFLNAIRSNPSAFSTLFHHEQFGTWLGASPELLLEQIAKNQWRTVALAGTQPYRDGQDLSTVIWNPKEQREQHLVCSHIASKLNTLHGVTFTEEPPATVKAGNVIHLKSVFTITTDGQSDATEMLLSALHPTSAVCGMPGLPAADFIFANERFNRSLYTGYWGPIGLPCDTGVYVNIRCMQIFDYNATIYAGAGITAESDPEKEWEETIMKSTTMESLLR